jgi:hypothetical protein
MAYTIALGEEHDWPKRTEVLTRLDDWAQQLSDADKCHLILDDGSDHKLPHFSESISDYGGRLSGLDIRGCWRLCHKTGGARLRIAGIAKFDANNLNFSKRI